mmetsp:Transcript_3262/g.6109  ORF Transcript_3262/g.6109 Transcript_3262/m.6109 type:complete len:257 (-) Transcript_3262:901-1671(-)
MDGALLLPFTHALGVRVVLRPLPLGRSILAPEDVLVLVDHRLALADSLPVDVHALGHTGEESLGLGVVESQDVRLLSLSFQPLPLEVNGLLKLLQPLLLLNSSFLLLGYLCLVLALASRLVLLALGLGFEPPLLALHPRLDEVLLLRDVGTDHLLLLLPVGSLRVDQALLVLDLRVLHVPILLLLRNGVVLPGEDVFFVDDQVGLVLVLGLQLAQSLFLRTAEPGNLVPQGHDFADQFRMLPVDRRLRDLSLHVLK